MYPETKGVPLEEMDIVFGEGIYRVPHQVVFKLISSLQEERTSTLDILLVEGSQAGSNAFLPRTVLRAWVKIIPGKNRIRRFVQIMIMTMMMMRDKMVMRMKVKNMR